MARSFVLLTLLFATTCCLAQDREIAWRTDPRQAVNEARASHRPLMVYVLGSTKDRDSKLERRQKQALRDPHVLRLAQQFVPLRLSRSRDRDTLKDFGLPQSANMMMSFVMPDGQLLGSLSAEGVAQANSLASKLALVFEAYGKKLYEAELKPHLTDAKAEPHDLKQALGLVAEVRIAVAETDVIALLDRPRLDQSVRKVVYETLAVLSTKGSVEKLLELSWDDELAMKALEKCTPVGAELMLAELRAEAEPFDYALYKAITKICGIRRVKPQRFFEKAPLRLKEKELDGLRKVVHAAAQRWKEMGGAG